MLRGHRAESGILRRLTGLSVMRLKMRTEMRPWKKRRQKRKRSPLARFPSLRAGIKFALCAEKSLVNSLNR